MFGEWAVREGAGAGEEMAEVGTCAYRQAENPHKMLGWWALKEIRRREKVAILSAADEAETETVAAVDLPEAA